MISSDSLEDGTSSAKPHSSASIPDDNCDEQRSQLSTDASSILSHPTDNTQHTTDRTTASGTSQKSETKPPNVQARPVCGRDVGSSGSVSGSSYDGSASVRSAPCGSAAVELLGINESKEGSSNSPDANSKSVEYSSSKNNSLQSESLGDSIPNVFPVSSDLPTIPNLSSFPLNSRASLLTSPEQCSSSGPSASQSFPSPSSSTSNSNILHASSSGSPSKPMDNASIPTVTSSELTGSTSEKTSTASEHTGAASECMGAASELTGAGSERMDAGSEQTGTASQPIGAGVEPTGDAENDEPGTATQTNENPNEQEPTIRLPTPTNLNELRERMFHSLFVRISIAYARATTPFVRRMVEFCILLQCLGCVGLLVLVHLYLHFQYPTCLTPDTAWNKSGILRVEVISDPSPDYSILDSYQKEEFLMRRYNLLANSLFLSQLSVVNHAFLGTLEDSTSEEPTDYENADLYWDALTEHEMTSSSNSSSTDEDSSELSFLSAVLSFLGNYEVAQEPSTRLSTPTSK